MYLYTVPTSCFEHGETYKVAYYKHPHRIIHITTISIHIKETL